MNHRPLGGGVSKPHWFDYLIKTFCVCLLYIRTDEQTDVRTVIRKPMDLLVPPLRRIPQSAPIAGRLPSKY